MPAPARPRDFLPYGVSLMRTRLIALSIATAFAVAGCATDSMNTRSDMSASAGASASASANPMVGGAAMYANKDIIDNAVNSADHTTLVAAVKAAGLVDTLKGAGPFTVFAPTNAAFSALPAGTVDTLLKPENKGTLTTVLTYHVVPGRVDAAALAKQIQAGGGQAMLKTVQGGTLTARMAGNGVSITDAKGNSARVTTADVYQSNGVIHVVDAVLMP
jgi:uncharacterized surface protein with fasciclin (FAS1) repeats